MSYSLLSSFFPPAFHQATPELICQPAFWGSANSWPQKQICQRFFFLQQKSWWSSQPYRHRRKIAAKMKKPYITSIFLMAYFKIGFSLRSPSLTRLTAIALFRSLFLSWNRPTKISFLVMAIVLVLLVTLKTKKSMFKKVFNYFNGKNTAKIMPTNWECILQKCIDMYI